MEPDSEVEDLEVEIFEGWHEGEIDLVVAGIV